MLKIKLRGHFSITLMACMPKYQLGAISKIDSIYATRLAEMLYSLRIGIAAAMMNDQVYLTLDELREYLGVPTNVNTGEPMFAEWRDF